MKIMLIPKYKSVELADGFWDNFEESVKNRENAHPNDLYGHYLPGDRFYMGIKDEPYIRNSFKTVIYGRVSETDIKYRYGKDTFACIVMIAMFLFALIGSIHLPITSLIELLGMLFICLWIPSHIYSADAMDMLYQSMMDMNKSETSV